MRHVDLTGKRGYLLLYCIVLALGIVLVLPKRKTFRKDIVANNHIVVCWARLASFQIRPIGIVGQSACFYTRFDEPVDRGVHVELVDGRYLYVAF